VSGKRNFCPSAAILSDRVLIDIKKIKEITNQIKKIKSFHQIRTRGDENCIFLDMHIALAPKTPLAEAYNISHQLKGKTMSGIPQVKDVVIHIEPQI